MSYLVYFKSSSNPQFHLKKKKQNNLTFLICLHKQSINIKLLFPRLKCPLYNFLGKAGFIKTFKKTSIKCKISFILTFQVESVLPPTL